MVFFAFTVAVTAAVSPTFFAVVVAIVVTKSLRLSPVFLSVTLISVFAGVIAAPVYWNSFVTNVDFTKSLLTSAFVILKEPETTPLYDLESIGLAVTLTVPTFTKSPV